MTPLLSSWFYSVMPHRKRRGAVELGRLRWAKMSPEERQAFVRAGVEARQRKKRLKESQEPPEDTS